MDPLTLGLIFGGTGLLKSLAIDGPKANRERQLASATQRYSPWTGLKAQPVQEADPFGSALQFGTTGATIGSGLKAADAENALRTSQKGLLDSQAAYWDKMRNPSGQ